MNKRIATPRFATLAIAAAFVAVPAIAATAPLQVVSEMLTEKKSAARDGSTSVQLVPAGRVTPGDRVIFRMGYKNVGAQPISGIVLDNPVPRQIAFEASTTPGAELSVDGKTYGALGVLRVALPGGGSRAAAPADITHVRWRVPGALAAGGHGQFTFRGVLK